MNNKNVPMETKALEIPDLALVELENKLTNLEHIVSTLEERLKTVSRPYNDNEPEATVAGTPLYSTTLGIRIDRSVTSVSNAVDRLRTMKYRIKAYHYKDCSIYYPQWRFLCFWNNFEDRIFGSIDFSSKIKAQKFLDDYVDKANPKIEWIPYERTN